MIHLNKDTQKEKKQQNKKKQQIFLGTSAICLLFVKYKTIV